MMCLQLGVAGVIVALLEELEVGRDGEEHREVGRCEEGPHAVEGHHVVVVEECHEDNVVEELDRWVALVGLLSHRPCAV